MFRFTHHIGVILLNNMHYIHVITLFKFILSLINRKNATANYLKNTNSENKEIVLLLLLNALRYVQLQYLVYTYRTFYIYVAKHKKIDYPM